METTTNERPVDRVRVKNIEIAFWPTNTKYGVKHIGKVQRNFRRDENFDSSGYLYGDDFLALKEAAGLAFHKAKELDRAARE